VTATETTTETTTGDDNGDVLGTVLDTLCEKLSPTVIQRPRWSGENSVSRVKWLWSSV
jgi:hypothetical protein